MCGIAGYWSPGGAPTEPLEARGRSMASTLACRGPDDEGVWTDADAGLVLSQTRLAVIDLSPAGRQPMVSASGRYVMVYNGEAYETDELRRDVEATGIALRGHSDTEIVLEACAAFGLRATLDRLVGMFAFALWDRETRTLALARDRFGIKPLYWGRFGETLVFGSELKALRAGLEGLAAFSPRVDRDALAAYLRFNCLPGGRSIYAGIAKLPPGHMIEIAADGDPAPTRWWDLGEVARTAAARNWAPDPREAEDRLDDLLRRAVGARMVADVPLGAFLSGGIDSSTVVSQMQAQSTAKIKTYTIGYSERAFDESAHAAKVAAHLGTDHHELILAPDDALEIIPTLAEHYDEPFADASQIPSLIISRFARQSVTVALSGDGGDELFGGYNRHVWAERFWRRARHFPGGLRKLIAAGLRRTPRGLWDGIERLPGTPRLVANKAAKVADMLAAGDPSAVYMALTTAWNPADLMEEGGDGLIDFPVAPGEMAMPRLAEHMQLVDALTYLPNDILTKLDRASMSVSLEARVPLLDHRLAAFAFALPRELKFSGGTGKILLRRVLARTVPPKLTERPKMGFALPLDRWLRGPLRDWAEDLLDGPALAASGLAPAPIHALWQAHLKGPVSHESRLWVILMYRLWHQRWMES